MFELGEKSSFLLNVEVLDVFKSVLGVKNRNICILSSSDKIFVFGKNGALIFDLWVEFLTKDMERSKSDLLTHGVSTDGAELKACSGCMSVCYAGREEQKTDWKRHKSVCKILQRLGEPLAQHPNPAMMDAKLSPPKF